MLNKMKVIQLKRNWCKEIKLKEIVNKSKILENFQFKKKVSILCWNKAIMKINFL